MAIIRVSGNHTARYVSLVSTGDDRVLLSWSCRDRSAADALVEAVKREWETPLAVDRRDAEQP